MNEGNIENLDLEEEKKEEASVDFSKVSQLDFSDVEGEDEDRECPYDLETRIRVIEAVLFISDKATGLTTLVSAFGEEEPVTKKEIKEALEAYEQDLVDSNRGFRLHHVDGGYQLRTDESLKDFLQNTIKARSFRLTGPSLETLAMIAYKQPCTKSQIDEIRGVESSHLVRALMDRDLVSFAGKSDLPGKPMLYKTTTKFLEVFGLRNIKELPSLAEIEALLPEGIGNEEEEKESLSDVTNKMSEDFDGSYSTGEEELEKINDQLSAISTETDFFEQEKQREKERRDLERAENIREALLVEEEVSEKDLRWLARYDEKINQVAEKDGAPEEITLPEEEQSDDLQASQEKTFSNGNNVSQEESLVEELGEELPPLEP